MKLKIMTYNIAGGRIYPEGEQSRRFAPEGCAEVISEISPDICGLNEVDKGLSRSERVDLLRFLSDKTGRAGFFAPAIFFDNGQYGNGLLSRFETVSAETVPIPDPEIKIGSRFESRCIVKAELKTEKGSIRFLCTHFGLNKSEQENAVKTIVSLIDNEKLPIILTGDFNVTPDAPVLKPIYDRLQSAGETLPIGTKSFPSYDSPKEGVLIDYIFLSKDFKITGAEIPSYHVSDHKPMICEVEF